MALAYQMTQHAQARMTERGISLDEMLAALEGRRHMHPDGVVEFLDPSSRVSLQVNIDKRTIITVYRKQSRQSRIRTGFLSQQETL